ncbi:MAG TPA: hypothetical protein EYQ50_27675 [Verrucomicrobiales bacterium]|nr:hypothetical protein [Verrucomicrobiales bacterium]
MGWESDQEEVKEERDRSKWILLGIPGLVVVMIASLLLTNERKQYNSVAHVQHILKLVPEGDAAAREAAFEEILEIKRQLDAGADFGDLAREHSDDVSNRDNGGDLGWYEHEETVPAFDSYIWIGEVGVVSEPIETAFGFHLIKIIERNISDAELYEINLNNRLNEINK